jgi:hypothetical protein
MRIFGQQLCDHPLQTAEQTKKEKDRQSIMKMLQKIPTSVWDSIQEHFQ